MGHLKKPSGGVAFKTVLHLFCPYYIAGRPVLLSLEFALGAGRMDVWKTTASLWMLP